MSNRNTNNKTGKHTKQRNRKTTKHTKIKRANKQCSMIKGKNKNNKKAEGLCGFRDSFDTELRNYERKAPQRRKREKSRKAKKQKKQTKKLKKDKDKESKRVKKENKKKVVSPWVEQHADTMERPPSQYRPRHTEQVMRFEDKKSKAISDINDAIKYYTQQLPKVSSRSTSKRKGSRPPAVSLYRSSPERTRGPSPSSISDEHMKQQEILKLSIYGLEKLKENITKLDPHKGVYPEESKPVSVIKDMEKYINDEMGRASVVLSQY